MPIILVYDFVEKKPRYWKWMNNSRPILGPKHEAAEFYGDVTEKAERQVRTLYPAPSFHVEKYDREKRFKLKEFSKAHPELFPSEAAA